MRSLFCAGIIGVVACGQVNSAKSDVAGPNPIGGSGGSTTPSGGGPVEDSAGFFVAATGSANSDMVQYMHQADAALGSDIGTTNFTSECKIDHGSADGGDILCVAEVEELDLWFNNLNIQYHVPSDMCSYLQVRPYWFYDYEPGTGPTVVSHEVAFDGTITDVANTVNGTPTCTYNYTSVGGPDCCTGSYNHTTTTYASDGSVASSTTVAGAWTGVPGNCAAGAAVNLGDDTTSLSSFGFGSVSRVPLPTVFYVQDVGLNNILQVRAPAAASYSNKTPLSSSIWTANFYTPSEHAGGMPVTLLAPAAVTGAPSYYTPSDTYDFTCLDAAKDIRQRIRLFVREWNTHSIAEGGDPDVTGTEPGYTGEPLNDLADWTDFGDNYPASSL